MLKQYSSLLSRCGAEAVHPEAVLPSMHACFIPRAAGVTNVQSNLTQNLCPLLLGSSYKGTLNWLTFACIAASLSCFSLSCDVTISSSS